MASSPTWAPAAAGQRLDWFYGGYLRDPDGNKICVYKLTGPAA
jgi:hypothetical protein